MPIHGVLQTPMFLWLAVAICTVPRVFGAEENDPHLILPQTVYAVAGQEANIYFDNIVLVPNIRNYQFDVDCKVGRQDQDRWRFTPEDKDVGSYPLEIQVRDEKDHLVAQASTTVVVSPRRDGGTRPVDWLIIGDSLTGASVYPAELFKLCEGDALRVKFVGSPGENGVVIANGAHEGYGGWTWQAFCTKWTEGPVEARRAARSSPFLVKENGRPVLNFQSYFNQYNARKAPEFITIMLGINDVFGATDADREQIVAEIFRYADTLIGAIRKAAPSTKIGIALTPPPAATQDAFGENYGCGQTRWQYRKNQHFLVEKMIEKFSGKEAEGISLIPVYLGIDCVNNYPKKDDRLNARTVKMTPKGINGVHPANEGYYQIADMIYAWFRTQLNNEGKTQ